MVSTRKAYSDSHAKNWTAGLAVKQLNTISAAMLSKNQVCPWSKDWDFLSHIRLIRYLITTEQLISLIHNISGASERQDLLLWLIEKFIRYFDNSAADQETMNSARTISAKGYFGCCLFSSCSQVLVIHNDRAATFSQFFASVLVGVMFVLAYSADQVGQLMKFTGDWTAAALHILIIFGLRDSGNNNWDVDTEIAWLGSGFPLHFLDIHEVVVTKQLYICVVKKYLVVELSIGNHLIIRLDFLTAGYSVHQQMNLFFVLTHEKQDSEMPWDWQQQFQGVYLLIALMDLRKILRAKMRFVTSIQSLRNLPPTVNAYHCLFVSSSGFVKVVQTVVIELKDIGGLRYIIIWPNNTVCIQVQQHALSQYMCLCILGLAVSLLKLAWKAPLSHEVLGQCLAYSATVYATSFHLQCVLCYDPGGIGDVEQSVRTIRKMSNILQWSLGCGSALDTVTKLSVGMVILLHDFFNGYRDMLLDSSTPIVCEPPPIIQIVLSMCPICITPTLETSHVDSVGARGDIHTSKSLRHGYSKSIFTRHSSRAFKVCNCTPMHGTSNSKRYFYHDHSSSNCGVGYDPGICRPCKFWNKSRRFLLRAGYALYIQNFPIHNSQVVSQIIQVVHGVIVLSEVFYMASDLFVSVHFFSSLEWPPPEIVYGQYVFPDTACTAPLA